MCEGAVIAAHADVSRDPGDLRGWLEQALCNASFAEELTAICGRLEVRKEEIIASQGNAADSMHFIVGGRVGVILRLDDGRSMRVRSLGPHTTIGEMGLITLNRGARWFRRRPDSVPMR